MTATAHQLSLPEHAIGQRNSPSASMAALKPARTTTSTPPGDTTTNKINKMLLDNLTHGMSDSPLQGPGHRNPVSNWQFCSLGRPVQRKWLGVEQHEQADDPFPQRDFGVLEECADHR
jgi:hypothetical protein